ncbi:hypothetical protein QBC46DRAFT_453791 [Diplogelasinospora grovesii]|uniref:Uncharacterized protein n=1 Tax=Diplogelasinospora grovesii TaxID=303347 RepID=A0AAN6RZZ9_9PEZI|nr:hypothetical protein QBC46DRAFT_453791 [Diplogelasinospora grovesii]
MAALDLIEYHPVFQVLICKACKSCFQTSISRHIRLKHNKARYTYRMLRDYEASFCRYPVITSRDQIREIQPPRSGPPIKPLQLRLDGILCLLCDPLHQPYICRTIRSMRDHMHAAHQHPKQDRPGRARGWKGRQGLTLERWLQNGAVSAPVACQSFFSGGSLVRYFPVSAPRSDQQARPGSTADTEAAGFDLRFQVEAALKEIETEEAEGGAAARGMSMLAPAPTSEQARWLQLTEWTRFLDDHPLDQVARLIDLPVGTTQRIVSGWTSGSQPADPVSDPPLAYILESLDRLLCFVYRRAWKKMGPDLHFCLWGAQSTALTETVFAAEELAAAVRHKEGQERLKGLQKSLDDKCLVFCISLLDHPLYGDIYDSLVVGFTAVLAIRETHEGKPLKRPRLSEAVSYTPHLSAIVKISQLLVAERALLAVERDEADYPAQAYS